VRPNFAHFQGTAARTSEDSGVLGREGSIDLRQGGYLRPESPTVSVSSGGHSPDMWPRRRHRCRPVLPPTRSPRWRRIEIANPSGCRSCRPLLRRNRASPKKSRSFSWTLSRPLCNVFFGPTSLMVRPVVCQACIRSFVGEGEHPCQWMSNGIPRDISRLSRTFKERKDRCWFSSRRI
jgi:hypothetical protein